ncbi:MAG: serine hydrolase [Geodermatophilaceae bacterium]|nr:serine hydrolase [Geodermatophilaceae bacterium]
MSTPGATSATSATSEAAQPEAAQPRLDQPQVAEAEIDFRAGIDAATDFAAEQGLTVSIAVIDRSADAEVVNGAAADTPVFGASLVKLFLADNLLHRQRAGEFQLGPRDRELLEAMLVASDDPAADSLYSRFGGDAMVTEVARRYQLPSVAPTNQAGEWELTTMSARDVARYYDRLLTRTPGADRDYLIDLLRRSAMIARDGFDQFFGIPAALPEQTWAIKQGWMCCPRDTSYLHTTAIIGADNRYTVAILSGDPGVTSPGFSTDALNRIAAILFPPGAVTD